MRKPYEDVSDDIKVMATDIITIVSQIFGVDKEIVFLAHKIFHMLRPDEGQLEAQFL